MRMAMPMSSFAACAGADACGECSGEVVWRMQWWCGVANAVWRACGFSHYVADAMVAWPNHRSRRKLKEAGAIDEAEFKEAKAKLLDLNA